MATKGTIQSVQINASLAEANTIVAAVAGRRIVVIAYVISSSVSNVIRWEDGAGGPILGRLNLGATRPFFVLSPVGLFVTSLGNLLNMNVNAGNVLGHLLFLER